ncbi:MAG: Clp protease N-terminal domain-containing protein [Gaiellaceae bacterium]
MFQRFTEPARQVVVLAQREARELRHNWIGTEHLLLGLLSGERGLAASVLADLGIELGATRAEVAQIAGAGEEIPGAIPFTPQAKRVLELALRASVRLGHEVVGTEHILLGLVDEGQGLATRVLLGFGVPPERVRIAVLAAFGDAT